MKTRTCVCALLAVCACGSDVDSGNELEVITTVTATFTQLDGPEVVRVEFNDPDGDGGEDPTIDSILLDAGEYNLSIGFENRLEEPPEIVTEEIKDEAAEHQLFFTGDIVSGPATNVVGGALEHAYTDEDPNGLPVGLQNSVLATAGSGTLSLMLRHLPPLNGSDVKTNDLAGLVRTSGLAALPGQTDVAIDFDVIVQ